MEITQTARVYVKYSETLAFGLCNDYGEENERIGLFSSYEELATYCRENGIHCVDLEPEEKDILTVYQYELRQKMPEDKRLTYTCEWGGEDGNPVYTFHSRASERMTAELARQIRYGAMDETAVSQFYGEDRQRPYRFQNEEEKRLDALTPLQVEAYQQLYPDGTRIELANMAEPFYPVPNGMRGRVLSVDETGNIHVVWDNGRCFPVIPNMDAFRALRPSELEQEALEQRARLEEINRALTPFEFHCENGLYTLSLPRLSNARNFQEAFTRFSFSCDEDGLFHYGTGHDWAQVFAEVFQNDPGLHQIYFESEEDRFCVASKNPYLLKRMGYAFKELCENEPEFQEVVDKVLHRIQEERMLCF